MYRRRLEHLHRKKASDQANKNGVKMLPKIRMGSRKLCRIRNYLTSGASHIRGWVVYGDQCLVLVAIMYTPDPLTREVYYRLNIGSHWSIFDARMMSFHRLISQYDHRNLQHSSQNFKQFLCMEIYFSTICIHDVKK